MSEINPSQSNPRVLLLANPEPQLTPPPWLAEAILIAQLWSSSGLLKQLQDSVQVPRGRAGTYEVCDFILLLLAYSVSHEHSLKDFRTRLSPYVGPLASLWERASLPSASALSRFLADVDKDSLKALGQLLFQDLLGHGIGGEGMGGLLDRLGQRHLLFDIDATVESIRQRSLVSGEDRPPPRRRRSRACAPGYKGRKRGELVHSRVVVQQAHSREWLGSFGTPGNSDLWGNLRRAGSQILQYLKSHGLEAYQGLVRQDGAYGYAQGAFILAREFGLGYLMRCADYRLLEDDRVVACLLKNQPEVFEQLDTGTVRDVYDVGLVEWRAGSDAAVCLPTRLVVTSTPAPEHGKPKVGKLRDGKVYELFVTDRAPEGLIATDLLSLYFGRGGFEQTLAEEDMEVDPDHWCSNHPYGQEFWQLLAQHVWNLRLRLGLAEEPEALRCTLWAEALNGEGGGTSEAVATPMGPQQQESSPPQETPLQEEPSGTCINLPAEKNQEPTYTSYPTSPSSSPPSIDRHLSRADVQEEPPEQSLRPAGAYGPGKFSGKDFIWQADGQLSCPAGKGLQLLERRREGMGQRLIYAARAGDCRVCSLSESCLHTSVQGYYGRRVSFVEKLEAPVCQEVGFELNSSLGPPEGPDVGLEPLLWEDLPARALRRRVWKGLSQQQVEIVEMPSFCQEPSVHRVLLSRDQRAHRRLSWSQRLSRNALPRHGPRWCIQLYGLPRGIAEKLGITLTGEGK